MNINFDQEFFQVHFFCPGGDGEYVDEVLEAEHEEEIWETENVSQLNEDIEGVVNVDSSEDVTDAFGIDNETQVTESSAIIIRVVNFLLALQRKHVLPDVVLGLLLKFFSILFKVLGRMNSSAVIIKIADDFPSSIYLLHKLVGNQKDAFTKYVTCPNPACMAIYKYKECFKKEGTKRVSEVCGSYRGMRKCKRILLKTVELATGKKLLYPFKIFCYQSIKYTLETLVGRPNFVEQCEEWRSREVCPGVYKDIYDGRIWRDFQTYDGKPFLSCKLSYGLMLNIDWFQPFAHVQYSVGAVYLAILNLPRHLRYQRENMILCAIIPGPREPIAGSASLNNLWKPLVDDLLNLWTGILLRNGKLLRAALLCVACDLPAGRKACGFLGHSATLGCSRCKKQFPGAVGKKDYSGFDRDNWTARNNCTHRLDVSKTIACLTITDREKKESELGVRYSEFLRLPYFDPVRMLIIDPMHCLYLGIAKHFKNVLISKEIITTKLLEEMQSLIDLCITPPGLGRIPHKVSAGTGFSGFTADQFKNWTNLFSLIIFSNISIPVDHINCWRYFVLASRIFSKTNINESDVLMGDALLLKFCRRVEELYGKKYITPNMHLSCHLKDCILDYGPSHGFWLFSYERMNGILKNQPNNNRAIEVQLMRRFLQDKAGSTFLSHDLFSTDFSPIMKQLYVLPPGSVGETIHLVLQDTFELSTKCTRDIFDATEKSSLLELYSRLYSVSRSSVKINDIYKKYMSVTIDQKKYKCTKHLEGKIFYIAKWDKSILGEFSDSNEEILVSTATNNPFERAIVLHYIVDHTITVSGNDFKHTLARVSWPRRHNNFFLYGKPVQCYYYSDIISDSFIPIKFLTDYCVHLCRDAVDGKHLIVLPLH